MATCPNCGTRYADHQRLCPHDGTVLEPERAPETVAVGRILDGKYRLDAFLSRGGMGAVYEATHVMLNRKVAVKFISPQLVTSADMVRRFQREARAVTHLNHPNIVRVHDLGQTEDGTLYIAMDLIAGKSLSDIIEAEQPLDDARIVHVATQIVSALAHAHEHGVIHRDLKPQNIMITRRPDGREVATLLDFGIAKTFEVDANTKLTSTGFAVGSPRYMSPEQAGAAPVDARSDIYSAGVILYEMLVGDVPFNDPSTPALLVKHLTETPVRPSLKRPDRHVSPMLEQIAMRCLEKKPEARFQSADELQRALAGTPAPVTADAAPTIAATTIAQPRATPRPRTAAVVTAPPEPRWRRYAAAAAVIVLLLAGAIAIIRSNRRDRAAQPAPTPSQQVQAPVATAPPQAVPPEKATDVPAKGAKAPQTPLSRALTGRIRALLTERRIGQQRFRGATLEMTMQPTRPGRGITANYVATVYTTAGERTFSGSQQGPAPQPLRNAVIEKLAAEIVTQLAATP
jgi:tRNA A-37 threonylcarbamoyl transferase component Bud32